MGRTDASGIGGGPYFSLSESAILQSCNVAFELSSPWMKFESVIATEQYLIVVLFVNLS